MQHENNREMIVFCSYRSTVGWSHRGSR